MMELRDKKISVIGAERSGLAAANLIKRLGGTPFVSDSGAEEKLQSSIAKLNDLTVEYEVGQHSSKVFEAEFAIISPGVPTNAKIVQSLIERKIRIISELEFASSFCKGKILAITGTNGKTTTTALTGHLLQTAGMKHIVAGNIGNAFSEYVLEIGANDYAVLEVSSFQLDWIEKFNPHAAAILNITPDHLNRYDNTMEKYARSKYRIFENMNLNSTLILNFDSPIFTQFNFETKADIQYFTLQNKIENGIAVDGENLILSSSNVKRNICSRGDISIKGEHNLMNAMAAILLAKSIDADDEAIRHGLRTFPGVEHRLEFVAEINGITFINDSKATNVDSVWYALKSYDKNICLILGGEDKGNDYSQIKELVLQRVKKIFAIGSSAKKVYDYFHTFVNCEVAPDFNSIVSSVLKEGKRNDILLLSPACASFDMFNNYEHRGKVFKDVVRSFAI